MAFTNLPPQAYTRDVLAAAYEWLRSQPNSIRELATNSDNLVSLYMQARRRPNTMPNIQNQPLPNVSVKNDSTPAMSSAGAEAFKNDLKNLAEGLKQFEDPRPTVRTQPELPSYDFVETNSALQSPLPLSPPPPSANSSSTMTHTPPPTTLNIDARSLETIRRVQALFNLSNEREALRLLIAVGLEKVKDFIGGS